jgi:hypothetical protein
MHSLPKLSGAIVLACSLAEAALCAEISVENTCRENLELLGAAYSRFLYMNEGKPPSRMSDLYTQGLVLDLGAFTCPAASNRIANARQIDELTSYEVTTNLADKLPMLLFKEKHGFHGGQALTFYSDRSFRKIAATSIATPTPTPVAVPTPTPPPRVAETTPTPAAPAFVTRGATPPPPPLGPTPVRRDANPAPVAKPAGPPVGDNPLVQVTKAAPGLEMAADAAFGDFMGVTFAFQADGKLVLGSVKADSIGADLGFKAGDAVVEINEKPAPKGTGAARPVPDDELAKLAGSPAGKPVLLTVQKADGEKITFSFMTRRPALPGR